MRGEEERRGEGRGGEGTGGGGERGEGSGEGRWEGSGGSIPFNAKSCSALSVVEAIVEVSET